MKYATMSLMASTVLTMAGCLNNNAVEGTAMQQKIRQGALVVDVRTPGEFDSGHYAGAVNIPLQDIESRLHEFGSRNGPIVLYCRSGNRSSRAKELLEKHGFSDVINGGGLNDMLKN